MAPRLRGNSRGAISAAAFRPSFRMPGPVVRDRTSRAQGAYRGWPPTRSWIDPMFCSGEIGSAQGRHRDRCCLHGAAHNTCFMFESPFVMQNSLRDAERPTSIVRFSSPSSYWRFPGAR